MVSIQVKNFTIFLLISILSSPLFSQEKYKLGFECQDVVNDANVIPPSASYEFIERKEKIIPTEKKLEKLVWAMGIFCFEELRMKTGNKSDLILGNCQKTLLSVKTKISSPKTKKLFSDLSVFPLKELSKKYPKILPEILKYMKIWMCREYTSTFENQIIVGSECFDVAEEVFMGKFVRFCNPTPDYGDKWISYYGYDPEKNSVIFEKADSAFKNFFAPLFKETEELEKKISSSDKKTPYLSLYISLLQKNLTKLKQEFPEISEESLKKSKKWFCKKLGTEVNIECNCDSDCKSI